MTEGKRPGGLTAMAVFNFIFGGFGVLGTLGMVALFAILSKAELDDEAQRELKVALEEMGGASVLTFIVIMSAVSTLLIIVAGIGYLKQKKVMGRMMGNGYAILSIVSSIASGMMFATEMGGGFNIGTMIGLIYPMVTLFLLNVTFADDFPN